MIGEGAEPAPLDPAEAFARIRLLRSPHVGPVSYAQLLARFGTAVIALEALPELAARGGRIGRVASEALVSAEVAAVRKAGARYLFHDSPLYPLLLRETEGAPPILIARGSAGLGRGRCVAMVGARNASAAAQRLAREFAAGLAETGWTVVSGLARGIDAAAHRGALGGALAGSGSTVGVIASGIDRAYPPENAALQDEVAERGLLLTEQPPGTDPLARHFPARNRVIAGMASGTVVVEAAPRSGSLITARLAGEFGREVMAVPGSPADARSRGCNQLIRDGATLVQSAEEIVEALSDFSGGPRLRLRETADLFAPAVEIAGEPPTDDLAALLGVAPVSIDELVRQSGAEAGAVHGALLELELAGRLQRHAGGMVSLA